MRKWPTIRVADEFDLQMGKTPARDNPAYWGGDQKWASIADIGRSGMYLSDTKETITQAAVSETGIKAIPSNTVVMSFKLSIGRTAITASKMYSNEAIMAFLPCDKSAFDLHFLYHLFSNRNWSEGCNKAVKGVTLNKATLNAARIPKPDILEQRAVALTLDHICNLIAKCDEQIVRLDKLVKSRFVEMFGDCNGSLFPQSTIGEVCEVKSGGTPDRKTREYWENGYIPWVKTTELKNCELFDSEEHITRLAMDESSAKLVPPETILLAMYGQGKTRGMTAKLKVAATTNQACACILPSEKINQDYLWRYLVLSYDKIRALAQGAGQPNLNGKMIRSFTLPLPPLALQREFAAFVEKVDKLAFAARRRRDVARQLYRAKIQEFFG